MIGRAVEDGKLAAKAEIGVWQAIASYRISGLKLGVPLLIAALFLAQAAVTALLVGLVFALAPMIGPGWSTALVVLVALLVVGGLGWFGVRQCQTLIAPLPEGKRS